MFEVTEDEWLTTTSYHRALAPLRDDRSTRRWRCFAIACLRLVWPTLNPAQRNAVEVHERFVQGQAIDQAERFDDLPILADALEDAGCADAAILDHCRRAGGHCRGCWVVDLILGKK